MTTSFNAAIIGCGRIASSFETLLPTQKPHSHAGAYDSHPRVNLIAGCDIDPIVRENFARLWRVQTYDNYVKMIQDNCIEMLSICTPPATHRDIVLDIIKRCPSVKLIWCEKPLAQSVRDCEEMLHACDLAGVSLTVNTWRRWDELHVKIKQAIESGVLGDICAVSARAHVGMVNTCTHLFDLLLMYFDSSVVSVYSSLISDGSCDPGAIGVLELESGLQVLFDNSWKKNQVFGVEIFGSEGILTAYTDSVLLEQFHI